MMCCLQRFTPVRHICLLLISIHVVRCLLANPEDFYTNELLKQYGTNDSIGTEQLSHLLNSLEQKLEESKSSSLTVTVNCSHQLWNENEECRKLKCLSSKEIVSLLNVTSLSKEEFRQICPALLYQAQKHDCVHFTEQKLKPTTKKVPTEKGRVWGFGFLFVTIVNVCSLFGVLVLPCMNKDFYQWLLLFMVALAVGTLAGSAAYFLIPDAYGLSEHDKEGSYVWKSTVIIGGIYMFFLVERLLKMLTNWKQSKHKKSSKTGDLLPPASVETQHDFEIDSRLKIPSEHHSCRPAHSPSTQQLVEAETLLKKREDEANGDIAFETLSNGHADIKDIKLQPKKKDKKEIAPVAWMIILGDALHNFVDGLSMGAAFSNSILSGISLSVAVICEELPHELGDFAILLNSGMTRCQALGFNFLSALTCYVGLFLGISLGESFKADKWIFALAGGMFLYISLVDMMNDVQRASEDERFKNKTFKVFIIQNLGLLVGFGLMLLLAVYSGHINFEQ